MSDLVWEEPPVTTSGGNRPLEWPARLAPLRERPGQWARVSKHLNGPAASSTANDLRKGRRPGVDPAEFEFTGRTIDGEGYVYARFIGEQDA